MSSAVLDASALLALLQQEPGDQQVADLLSAGVAISAVNLSEVVAKLGDLGWSEQQIREQPPLHALEVIPFDTELAYQAGLLRPLTRQAGLSLGDRACLALAMQCQLPAVTADRAWQTLGLRITIHVIR